MQIDIYLVDAQLMIFFSKKINEERLFLNYLWNEMEQKDWNGKRD